jgi:hypothetical protein
MPPHCFRLADQRENARLEGAVTFQDAVRPLRSPIQYLMSCSHATQMALRDDGFPLAASCGCTVFLPNVDGVRHSLLAA